MTHVDICGSFEGDTLLAIQGPQGTQLEVPRPELSMVPGQKNKYQVEQRILIEGEGLCQCILKGGSITVPLTSF